MSLKPELHTAEERLNLLRPLLLIVCGIAVNMLGMRLALALSLPLFLDSIGTVVSAMLGGFLPGVLVGYITNLIGGIEDPITTYYATINVLLAVVAAWSYRRGWLKRVWGVLVTILLLAVVGGGLGSCLTWLLYGMDFGTGISAPLAHRLYEAGIPTVFLSQLLADMVLDLPDKAVVLLLSLLTLRLMPLRVWELLTPHFWMQKPLTDTEFQRVIQARTRGLSLRARVVLLLATAVVVIAVAAVGINAQLYHQTTIEEHTKLGASVSSLVASALDPERVDDYLALGEAAEGYAETKERLSVIRESSPDIEYVYVYRILPDGCHVVFDLDTEDLPGSPTGEIIPFDESFVPYLGALLTGQRIEPLITNDTYGWLLTAYEPVYNAEGQCVCYACADISMGLLTEYELSYVARTLALFLGLLVLILVAGLILAEYTMVLPVNTMAEAAGSFAYSNEEEGTHTVERIRGLEITTGDEIENLYHALTRTTEDIVRYIGDVKQKNETISRMQNGLILVLADMVESRDQCTGDHVRKTAAYVEIILRRMRRDGVYAEQLTEEFIEDVINSAPLHDVGKIHISDTLLNKPGKLTDEEYQLMKTHTTAGAEVISHAIALVSDAGYLEEARNLALCHHERWDGKGYPKGLRREEIPLSARVMAVADVFDALVSRRSYKEPFPFEKAMDIIREGQGTQFDPLVAQEFLDAEEEVRRVAEAHHED